MRAGSSTKKQYFNAMATVEIKYRRPASNIKQEQDDDSDTEEPHLGLKKSDGRESQIIHSGHFMVSSPHIEHPPKKGYDFDTVNKQTCQTYHFGKTSTSHLSIDASLTKLFECMTLAYSGKLVSPKWKNFKGLKLLWRDKIRLNNAIWRAWYIQYVEKRENPVCHFVTPLEGTIDSEVHRHAEAIATEGKYWKRRIEIVIREYHKWRTYFKKRLQRHKDDDLSSLLTGAEEQYSLFGEVFPDTLHVSLRQDEELGVGGRRGSRRSANDSPVPMEMDQLFDMDLLMSEFTDTLFSTLASHQPVAWPNPREIAHAGNADMIQPGLIPLQPNLDFMDTFEPLQDLFHALRQPVFPSTSQTQPAVLPALQLPPDLAPISLDQRLIPLSNTPPITNQSTASAVGPAYSQNYMPLFAGQVASPAHIPAQPLMPPPGPPLPPPYRHQNQTVAVATNSSVPPSSVVTHMAPSTVTPSNAATTFSHGSDFLPSQLQQPQAAQPSTTSLPPHNQSFALPRPIQPSSSTKKTCRVQRIIPAPTLPSSQLILTAPFPGHTSAVIVTPSPMKADVVPTTGLVVASPSVPRVSAGFHILPQTQKSPQLIVPKEEMASAAANSKISTPSTGATCDGRASGQGSPCALEQAPSPQSPLSSGSSLAKSDTSKSRRSTHISAEQKRRFNINIAFKTLCGMVPTLKSQSNTSNAATLQKTVDYIGKLQQDRLQMQEETRRLKEEIEELNASINMCQEQLPATGVPMTRQRFDHMWEKFEDYVRSRTLQDWKFWIFSVIIKPLFETFNSTVSTTNKKELCETTMQWLECHCTLPILRPMVLGSLRQLSTSTSILSDPSLVAQEARQAVTTPKRYSEQT